MLQKKDKKMIDYKTLFSRNIGILKEEEQEKIKNTKVAILGCGGGSEIARQMVQSGFVSLKLADMDTVAPHNLNRQFYFQKDIGKKKTHALDENLRMINPNITTEILDQGVNTNNIEEIVYKSDLIIDAIPQDTALREEMLLAREVRKSNNKYLLYFMDIVWGAKALIFSKTSQTLEEFYGLEPNCELYKLDKLSIEKRFSSYLENASSDMIRVGNMMYKRELNYYPQMALTVSLAGSVVATMCIFLIMGKKIPLAPFIYHIDYYKDLVE
ncbi:hypothetical protein A3A76_04275 [Candidatus Woesebacteria bacterium RIFCSPLOWO2_01_FULL_39_23]|uniref:THIF-type NAD/FAD binding fold domain-containing protein n=1 Tax=Candidatus Woesebacteria bacterium RIFCSPHIGHO2_01_FULL_40_22 TaxID=1802499 RepID=A0A1F7YGF6_9BACT|nr:MAG: hypothetical protein A2141_01840 [Candidatus Woesebacteria bacterium RBG_16_40_11]OGM25969.1 MAG: hypothetical protein A2628_00275 [Candidatus Woesebacteria bacterium RIFCSPHIGHO2_01_FULL_40_22]OGM38081.1 MAG: hypothetical protein A3E41_03360 [Candidatus Woesebacteria bacterium RIFCSPHIGHO2_12_FULL_38_9]OGM61818.1 MAG: hypothetical protein A3A76_04275 [Candidatus Woesebacteria bacterium RIFCSPLOWO2_01_FULL_39_23]